jgi:hypothetical protein
MDDAPHIRTWIRARWQFADGRLMTRTVKRAIAGDPEDTERRAVALYELLAELPAIGHDFPEGHGVLIEVLGTITD